MVLRGRQGRGGSLLWQHAVVLLVLCAPVGVPHHDTCHVLALQMHRVVAAVRGGKHARAQCRRVRRGAVARERVWGPSTRAVGGSHGRLVLHLNIRAASSCEGYGLHWNAASSTLVAVCVNVLRLPLQRVGGSARGGVSTL